MKIHSIILRGHGEEERQFFFKLSLTSEEARRLRMQDPLLLEQLKGVVAKAVSEKLEYLHIPTPEEEETLKEDFLNDPGAFSEMLSISLP